MAIFHTVNVQAVEQHKFCAGAWYQSGNCRSCSHLLVFAHFAGSAPGGGTLQIFGRGCAAGTLKPLP